MPDYSSDDEQVGDDVKDFKNPQFRLDFQRPQGHQETDQIPLPYTLPSSHDLYHKEVDLVAALDTQATQVHPQVSSQ